MSETIRKNLALLTLMAALVGGLVSRPLRGKVHHGSKSFTQEELRRELELGTKMPVVAVSKELTRRFAGTVTPADLVIQLKTADRSQLFVPDKYAVAAVGCASGDLEFQRLN